MKAMICLTKIQLTYNMENANTQFGLPTYNVVTENVQQTFDDTCAIKSQEIVMNAAGLDVSESRLREEAIQNGWYSPGYGTPMEDVGKLMEAHGMEVQQNVHGNMFNLVSELSKGHPVIVGVDSGELWNPGIEERLEDFIKGHCADHALIVGGVEFNDDFTGGTVNLIDPGTGDFAVGYNLDQFSDAWADSDNFMLTIL